MANPLAVTLRPMVPDDALAVAALAGQLGYPTPAGEMRARIERLAPDPLQHLRVALLDGVVVGWIAGEDRTSLEAGRKAEITGLVVGAAHRRAGVGHVLVAGLEQWARSRGLAAIVVRSNAARVESHPFYGQLGFRRAKTQHAYEKRLAPS